MYVFEKMRPKDYGSQYFNQFLQKFSISHKHAVVFVTLLYLNFRACSSHLYILT